MANRISRSSIDWVKVSTLFSKAEQSEFLKLKAKSDASLRKVVQFPEKPPEINFNAIKTKVVDKSAIDQLEKAYKALSIKFPGDNNANQLISEQERKHIEEGQKLIGKVRAETKEANELLDKFEKMIPFDQMYPEEFIQTFPDWADTPQSPALLENIEKVPGLTKKQYYEISQKLDLNS